MPKARQDNKSPHIPVLPGEVLKYLAPRAGQSYLDLTAGYGGHAHAVLEMTKAPGRAVLADRDEQAIDALKKRFGKNVKIVHQDFLQASQKLEQGGEQFDLILADLGTSSPHLDQPDRGFAFKQSGPLDMRMDQSQELTAETIVNDWPEVQIAGILKELGEEPKARQIARMIVVNRPVTTTGQLAEIVKSAYRLRRKVHPATKTFQALRIAVNGELEQLEQSLPLWLKLLSPSGRLVIISFHSLEDRLVKRFLAEHGKYTYDAQLQLLTKKPVTAQKTETDLNPRARSAKLRAAAKIKTKERIIRNTQ